LKIFIELEIMHDYRYKVVKLKLQIVKKKFTAHDFNPKTACVDRTPFTLHHLNTMVTT